jgi:hypothetical protein
MAWASSALGAAGAIFGGLFGAHASNNAANQYIKYLQQAEDLLQGQEKQGLQNFQPFQEGGARAEKTLSDLMGTPGQGLLTPWTQKFAAPTAAEAEQTPGYQFQLQQGENALQNSAAGKGSLLSGRTMADLNNYAQGVASTNYQNTFNNALTQYQTAYQSFLNNQQNTYNMLQGQAGLGAQTAGMEGQFMSGMAGDEASLLAQMGRVRAGGTLGAAAGYTSILPGIANAMSPMGGMGGGMGGGGGFNLGMLGGGGGAGGGGGGG